MPVATTNDFLEALRKSDLLEAEELDTALASYPGSLDEPTRLAEFLIDRKIITKFQAKSLLSGRYRGLIIGPYKIMDKIGAGGMGIVYLAEHLKLHRRVAIKVLPEDKTKDKLSLERFYREARAVAALDHPNIVKAFDVAEHEGMHYFVMEYIDGANLQRYLDTKGPLQWKTAVNVAMQACKGLQQAHERGLVHRDIKPANILVDKSGQVKILDLGLARSFDEKKDNLTQDLSDGKDVMGSIDYIAPEQAIANKPVDIRADIYSLGATLYALIAGRPPVEGTTAQKLLQHQVQMPTPVHKVKTDVPEGISTVMAKMMAKKPEHRFATPNDVIAAFTPFVTGQTQLFPQLGQTLPGTGPVRGMTSGSLLNPTAPVPSATPLLREVGQSVQTGPIEEKRDTSKIKKTKKLKKKRKQRSNTWLIVICTAAVIIPIVSLLFIFLNKGKEESNETARSTTPAPANPNRPIEPQPVNTNPGNTNPGIPNVGSSPTPPGNVNPPTTEPGGAPPAKNEPRYRPADSNRKDPNKTAPTKPRPVRDSNSKTPTGGGINGSESGSTDPGNPRSSNPGGSDAPPAASGAPNPGGTLTIPPPPTGESTPPIPSRVGDAPPNAKSETPPVGSPPPGNKDNTKDNNDPPRTGNSTAYPPMGANFVVRESQPMADIVGEDFDNTNFRLSDYEGKVILLDFWGFWCPHCVKMFPHEKEMVEKLKDRPFVLLGVNNDKTKDIYDRGMKQHKLPWRNFKDRLPDGTFVTKRLGVRAFPSLILIDHRGIVRKIWVGAPKDDELDRTIEQYIKRAESGS